MPKLKFDLSDQDPDESTKVVTRQSPRPGMYVCTILEINEKPSKSGAGPQLEVILEVSDADKGSNKQFIGSRLWWYVMLPGHNAFDSTAWKLDQLLQSLGIATKKKRKGYFDPDKFVGEEVLVNVRGGKSQDGKEYRGEVSGVLAYDEDSWESGTDDEDDDEEYDEDDVEVVEEDEDEVVEEDEDEDVDEDDDEDAEDAEDEDDEDAEDEDEDGEEEEGYEAWSIKDLKAELVERELNPRGTKPTLIERLEDDDGEEDDADVDEEEEEPEPEPEPKPRKRATAKKATAKKATAKKATTRKKTTAKKSTAKKTTARGGSRGRGKSGFPFEG